LKAGCGNNEEQTHFEHHAEFLGGKLPITSVDDHRSTAVRLSLSGLEVFPAASSPNDPNRMGDRMQSLLDEWRGGARGKSPIIGVRELIQEMRRGRKSSTRRKLDMKSFINCLGQPDNLATWIEILLTTAKRRKESLDVMMMKPLLLGL
jgi:hypothetical protein